MIVLQFSHIKHEIHASEFKEDKKVFLASLNSNETAEVFKQED